METFDLIRTLKTVPEIKLKIIPLSWELVNEHGEIDSDKALAQAKEVEEAVGQAKAYVEGNRRLLSALKDNLRSTN